MGKFDAVTAEVTALDSATDSLLALFEDFASQVEANKNDPVAIQAIADSIRADSAKMAAAVVAHTPAAPEAKKR